MVSFRSGRRARAAATRTATTTAALADYESALQAARSLWLASDRVRRSELSAFARSLDLTDRYPGLQGIGWRPLVTHRELPAFLARTRAHGEPGFTIRPPGRRPVYHVTEYSYPRIPTGGPGTRSCRASWPGRPARPHSRPAHASRSRRHGRPTAHAHPVRQADPATHGPGQRPPLAGAPPLQA